MSRKRKHLSMRRSKRVFTNTAKSTHPKNLPGRPMRGGFRI